MSVNKVILIGNIGSDPNMRYPEQGVSIASMSLATNERIGEMERTEWHNIIMTGRNAEFAERYIRKGTKLYVEGKIRYSEWVDKLGVKRVRTDIYVDNFELLGRRSDSEK